MATETAAQGHTARPGDAWRRSLAGWAVPESLRDDGGDRSWSLDPERFRWKPDEDAERPVRPSRRRALEALPQGGSVLDVGVGGGASSFGLAARAGLITGVDRSEAMLELFRATAPNVGVEVRTVHGAWPDVADQVEPAHVALSHHAMYGVEEIEDFVTALTARARHRVVLELSALPPNATVAPLWKELHGLVRPLWLVADEAEAVLLAMGLAVEREDIVLPPHRREVTPELVAFARSRLHVGEEHDREIARFLRDNPPTEQRVVALYWRGSA